MLNNLRTDATNNADLFALKNFSLGEKTALQYTFETFNALNYVQLIHRTLSPPRAILELLLDKRIPHSPFRRDFVSHFS
jgi:hypothetical protein